MVKRINLACLSAALLFGLMVTGASGLEKARWGVHFRDNPLYGIPALAAVDRGFFKEQGLEVEVIEFASAGLLERAYAAGALEVGTTGMPDVAVSVSRGSPQIMVGDPKMRVDFVLWALVDSPIKRPEDLKGTNIGVTRFGISPHILATAALRQAGLEGQAKFVAVGGGPEGMAALKMRSIQTLALSNFTLIPLQAKGEVKVGVNLSDFVAGAKVAGAQAITAHRDYAKKNPDAVKRAVRSFMRGADFVLKNKDWAIQKIMNHYRQPKEAAEITFSLLNYGKDARIDVSKVASTVEFLVESGLLAKDKAPALEAVYIPGLAD